MEAFVYLAAGYLAGSIPFGVLVTRLARGEDVRAKGSGNIGATNVARVAGKKLGALVLVLDALKGAVPVVAAIALVPEAPRLHALVGLAAFLGHVFPIWLRLRGGKGVATALGVLLVLAPWAALSGAVVWLALVSAFRISSIGSLAGGLVAVGVAVFTARQDAYAWLTAALFGMMLFTHRANLSRLLRRSEPKV